MHDITLRPSDFEFIYLHPFVFIRMHCNFIRNSELQEIYVLLHTRSVFIISEELFLMKLQAFYKPKKAFGKHSPEKRYQRRTRGRTQNRKANCKNEKNS